MRMLLLVLGLVSLTAGCCHDRCSSYKIPADYLPPNSDCYPTR